MKPKEEKKFRDFLLINLLASILLGIVFIIQLINIPSDSKNEVLWGLSINRILVILFFLAGILLISAIIIKVIYQWVRINAAIIKFRDKQKTIFVNVSLGLIFLGMWAIINLPDYYLHDYVAYVERLRPILSWALIIIIQYFILFLFYDYSVKSTPLLLLVQNPKRYFYTILTYLFTFCIIWLILEFTASKFINNSYYVGGTEVPILNTQILFSMSLSIIFCYCLIQFILKNVKIDRLIDIFLFISIWLIAFLAWSSQPVIPTSENPSLDAPRFSPPRPPNYEIAPLSDGLRYDERANLVLIGEHKTESIDKSLFISYLTSLNLLAGPGYEDKIRIQTVIYSLFPALLFLLGKSMHSRPAGFLVAILAIFKELNSLASTNQIIVVSTQMLYTEFATAFCLVIFLLSLSRWSKEQKNISLLFISGGLLGITLLIRLDAALIYPMMIFIFLLFIKEKLKKKINLILVFSFGIISCMLPWALYCQLSYGDALLFIKAKTQGVLYESRYLPLIDHEDSNTISQATPIITTQELRLTEELKSDGTPQDLIKTNEINNSTEANTWQISKLTTAVLQRLINNISTSFFVLPTYFSLHDLTHAIRITPWNIQASNVLSVNVLAILINLFIIAIGVAVSFMRLRINGLFPLFVFLAYISARSIALQSAGRNIVPVDWIIFFYYSIGIVECILIILTCFSLKTHTLLSPDTPRNNIIDKANKEKINPKYIVLFLLIGLVPVLYEGIFPKRYPTLNKPELINEAKLNKKISHAFTDKINTLLEDESSQIFIGRALYPRFYEKGEGDEPVPYSQKGYPNLVFKLLGSYNTSVVLPISESPAFFPNISDVIVIGCPGKDFLTAELVILLNDENQGKIKTINLSSINEPLFFNNDINPANSCASE